MDRVKNLFLNTVFGSFLMSSRDIYILLSTGFTCKEQLGTVMNDQLSDKLISKLCKPSKYFVDAGAHIGSFISKVLKNNSSQKIIAIEADPDKAKLLKRKFPSVETHSFALSDNDGEVSFFINTEKTGYSSLLKPTQVSEEKVIEIKVTAKKLDDIVLNKEIDVIKIDVEGAELNVLIGSCSLIQRCRPTVMFESTNLKESVIKEMWNFFTQRDYLIFIPNRMAHDGPSLTIEGFLESHYYPRRTINYFAIAKERRIEVRNSSQLILGIKN